MPWKAVAQVAGFWPFGAFCSSWVACDIMCSTASILNLCMISVDRYWAIASPFRYERKMTRRVAFIMIGMAWTLALFISFVPVQLGWHKTSVITWPNSSTARHVRYRCDSRLNPLYAIVSSLVSFYIPVVIMIVTYTHIYVIAQQQIRRISSLERAAEHAQNFQMNPADNSLKSSFKKETKVLKTLSVIMGVFVCCWLPFFVLNCTVPFCSSGGGLPCVSRTTFEVFVWFGWANSALNPIIYAFNADFRRAFASLLGCRRCSCKSTIKIEAVDVTKELASVQPESMFDGRETPRRAHLLLPHVVMLADEEDGIASLLMDDYSRTSPLNGDLVPREASVADSMEALSLDKMLHLQEGCICENSKV
uniref:D(1B) dopamine receptor-like n=1 Tax=Myxine glutinosa TaxID=7769 RepID=UPI00358EC7F7